METTCPKCQSILSIPPGALPKDKPRGTCPKCLEHFVAIPYDVKENGASKGSQAGQALLDEHQENQKHDPKP